MVSHSKMQSPFNSNIICLTIFGIVSLANLDTVYANEDCHKSHEEKLLNILSETYYPSAAPRNETDPTNNKLPISVGVQLTLLNIKLDPKSVQSFEAEVQYQLSWTDARLRVPPNLEDISRKEKLEGENGTGRSMAYKLSKKWLERVWTPHLRFVNVIQQKEVEDDEYLWVTNLNELTFTTTKLLTLECDMDLTKYPFDHQRCYINISSLKESSPVHLYWEWFVQDFPDKQAEFSVVRIDNGISNLTQTTSSTMKAAKGGGKVGSSRSKHHQLEPLGLYIVLDLQRNTFGYITKKFAASMTLAIVSTMCLWSKPGSVPSLMLSVVMSALGYYLSLEVPVSYPYAMQVLNQGLVYYAVAVFTVMSWGMLAEQMRDHFEERLKREAEAEAEATEELVVVGGGGGQEAKTEETPERKISEDSGLNNTTSGASTSSGSSGMSVVIGRIVGDDGVPADAPSGRKFYQVQQQQQPQQQQNGPIENNIGAGKTVTTRKPIKTTETKKTSKKNLPKPDFGLQWGLFICFGNYRLARNILTICRVLLPVLLLAFFFVLTLWVIFS